MGKDNRKKSYLFYVAIPVSIFLYVSLLYIDKWAVSQPQIAHLEKKSSGFNEKDLIEGLIIGGSNAFYSISAVLLSKQTNENWYNLSISGEGFSDQNYFNFLTDNLDYSKRKNVKKIIYSSIYYFRRGEIDFRENSRRQIDGSNKFAIKPRFSGITYLQRLLLRKKLIIDYPNQSSFGDIIFTHSLCSREKIFQRFEIEDFDKIHNNLISKLKSLSKIFPNAEITVVFPKDFIEKELHGEFDLKIQSLIKFIDSRERQNYSQTSNLTSRLIFQTPFSSKQLCDTASHANKAGRRTRTNELMNFLPKIEKL
tara:strand:+ start:1148 stop:2077 length:930 start_codon:yes stop_codon:yes gene_type:complete